MITEQIINNNKDFLDKVALETVKQYIQRQPMKSFSDSMSLARIGYKQALAMLEVRENSLETLAKESGLIKN